MREHVAKFPRPIRIQIDRQMGPQIRSVPRAKCDSASGCLFGGRMGGRCGGGGGAEKGAQVAGKFRYMLPGLFATCIFNLIYSNTTLG
jgi:hypothetical protein